METNTNYQIRIKGHLDERWMRHFEGLEISNSHYEHVAARRSWFLLKQSPDNMGLLRRKEQEPSSQRHTENCCLEIAQHPNGETVISDAMNQSALYGILNHIRDLGMELISAQHHPAENKGERQ